MHPIRLQTRPRWHIGPLNLNAKSLSYQIQVRLSPFYNKSVQFVTIIPVPVLVFLIHLTMTTDDNSVLVKL